MDKKSPQPEERVNVNLLVQHQISKEQSPEYFTIINPSNFYAKFWRNNTWRHRSDVLLDWSNETSFNKISAS